MKNFFNYLLEILLPRSESTKRLEEMSAGEFWEVTRTRATSPSPSFLGPTFLFDYRQPLVRQAIWELKYRGNKKITRLLAQCLYEELAEELSEKTVFENLGKPLLIPIPLSKKRRQERGFNQCELLANELEAIDTGNFFEVSLGTLIKIRDTESQTKKGRTARLENLKNCFAIPIPPKIAGRSVILLDDVTTTGATFEEAKRTIISAGAKKVFEIAVAH